MRLFRACHRRGDELPRDGISALLHGIAKHIDHGLRVRAGWEKRACAHHLLVPRVAHVVVRVAHRHCDEPRHDVRDDVAHGAARARAVLVADVLHGLGHFRDALQKGLRFELAHKIAKCGVQRVLGFPLSFQHADRVHETAERGRRGFVAGKVNVRIPDPHRVIPAHEPAAVLALAAAGLVARAAAGDEEFLFLVVRVALHGVVNQSRGTKCKHGLGGVAHGVAAEFRVHFHLAVADARIPETLAHARELNAEPGGCGRHCAHAPAESDPSEVEARLDEWRDEFHERVLRGTHAAGDVLQLGSAEHVFAIGERVGPLFERLHVRHLLAAAHGFHPCRRAGFVHELIDPRFHRRAGQAFALRDAEREALHFAMRHEGLEKCAEKGVRAARKTHRAPLPSGDSLVP